MQNEKWSRIDAVFAAAIQLPEDEQLEFVEKKCESDTELIQEIMSLLEKDELADGFLSQSILSLGTKIIGNNPRYLIDRGEFGFYKIKKLLGRGGMGEVFLAEDIRLDREVALKILPVELTEDSILWRRFQQEARAASRVMHPGVAHIYEFGKQLGLYFLAMEYVPGKTLRELIRKNSIDVLEAVKFIKQIVGALEEAHLNQIVHCDIKPENIIVGHSGMVKVLDFGLAKYRNSQFDPEQFKNYTSFTNSSLIAMGTVPYMSPEQINRQSIDQRTDLWSVGVIFYEILVGIRPFVGSSQDEIISAICRLPTKSLLFENCPPPAKEIVARCLEKNKSERYQSATELLADLNKLEKSLMGEQLDIARSREAEPRHIPINLSAIQPGYFLATVCFFLIFVGLSAYYLSSSDANKTLSQIVAGGTHKKISELAIMKFRVRTADTDSANLQNFSLEFGRELITVLGESKICTIKAERDSWRYENTQDANFIGRKLGADTVLRGEITRSGNQFQVDLELIDTHQGAVIWQDKLLFNDLNFLEWRYALLNAIARNLVPHLASEKLPGSAGKRLSDLYFNRKDANFIQAYQLYLDGKYNSENFTQSIDKLKESIELNANYDLAYLALASKYWTNYEFSAPYDQPYPDANIENIKSQLQLAIYLNKNNSEAHRFLSLVKWKADRDWIEAEKELKLAIEINPNNEWALLDYGSLILPAKGKFSESIRILEKAGKIMPLTSEVPAAIARTKFLMLDFQGAVTSSDEALALNSGSASARATKALALSRLGRNQEALQTAQAFNESDEIVGLEGQTSRAIIYAANGNGAQARQIIKEIESQQKLGNKNVTPYRLAIVYAAIANPTSFEKARIFDLLQEEEQLKSKDFMTIKFDPLLESAASDPRFAKFKNPPKV